MASYGLITVNTSGLMNDAYEYTVIDCTNGDVTIDLNSISDNGDGYTFMFNRRDTTSNINICTLVPNNTDTIAGVASMTLIDGQIVRLIAYQTDWIVILNL